MLPWIDPRESRRVYERNTFAGPGVRGDGCIALQELCGSRIHTSAVSMGGVQRLQPRESISAEFGFELAVLRQIDDGVCSTADAAIVEAVVLAR